MLQGNEIISEVLRREVGKESPPINTTEMAEWIEQNSEKFDLILANLDELITDFNNRSFNQREMHLINARSIKSKLGENALPTFKQLTESSGFSVLKRFMSVVRQTSILMKKGELPKAEREKPYLRYHTTITDTENLVVGGIVHAYEDMCTESSLFQEGIRRDELVDALIELASERPELGIFRALSDKQGMNWVDGYAKLSEEFRKMHGFG